MYLGREALQQSFTFISLYPFPLSDLDIIPNSTKNILMVDPRQQ